MTRHEKVLLKAHQVMQQFQHWLHNSIDGMCWVPDVWIEHTVDRTQLIVGSFTMLWDSEDHPLRHLTFEFCKDLFLREIELTYGPYIRKANEKKAKGSA